MKTFFLISTFILAVGILVLEPLKEDTQVAIYPETEKEVKTTVEVFTIKDANQFQKMEKKVKEKELGKSNSNRSMNSIRRDDPLVMEDTDVPFEPLNL